MCVCICVHACMYVCMYVYMCIYICTYVYMYTRVEPCISMHGVARVGSTRVAAHCAEKAFE